MNIGENIKRYREAAGMTQDELSNISSIAREHISRIENDKFTPNIKTAVLIADALGVSLMELLEDKE